MKIYRALAELARRYQFRNRDEVCCYGLTVSQCYALEFLVDSDSAPTSKLAGHLGLDPSTTTRLIDQLVRKKLVTRERNLEDARIREIRVTEAGRRLATRVQQDLASLLDNALSDLPEPVRKALPDVLARITFALNECCEVSAVIPPGTIRKIGS